MQSDYYPLYIKPAVAVPSSGAIRVRNSQHRYFDIADHTELIWTILDACNGHRRVPEVVAKVGSDLPGTDPGLIEAIIDDLTSVGVLADQNQAYTALHALTNNILPGTAKPGSLPPSPNRQNLTPKALSKSTLLAIVKHSSPLVKLFVIVTTSQPGYPTGYYAHDAESGQLIPSNEHIDALQLQYIFNREAVPDAPVIVVITADLQTAANKYGNRGYRYAQLEAGQVLQTVSSAAATAGVAAIPLYDYLDQALASELNLGGAQVEPLVTVVLGSEAEPPDPAGATLTNLKVQLVGKTLLFSDLRISPDDGLGRYMARVYAADNHQPIGFGVSESSSVAAVKALAESFEVRASGNVRVEKTASATKLAHTGASWLDPRHFAPLTGEQYHQFPDLQPFTESAEWQWVEGKYEATGEAAWVPVDLVFYPLNTQPWHRRRCTKANSSGVAAHTLREKAVENGLTELVERHAILQSWYHRQPPPQIPLELLPYHWHRRAKYWRDQGRTVRVLDLSAFGVTVIGVYIVAETYPCFISGAGSSIESFEAALTKAFHEAEGRLQSVLNLPAPKPIQPDQVQTTEDHARLYAFPELQPELQWLWGGGTASNTPLPSARLPQLLAKLEAVTVSLSDGDAPLQVVRVLSRHLVPISFGYGLDYYTHPALGSKPIAQGLPHYFP